MNCIRPDPLRASKRVWLRETSAAYATIARTRCANNYECHEWNAAENNKCIIIIINNYAFVVS